MKIIKAYYLLKWLKPSQNVLPQNCMTSRVGVNSPVHIMFKSVIFK